jgi:Leucine-rich repeat (LRR) protein
LYQTNLSGQIPSSIGNLSNLVSLLAHRNNLEGPIPASIANMTNLLKLDLAMNRLNGSFPKEIFKLPVISIYLNLSYHSPLKLVASETLTAWFSLETNFPVRSQILLGDALRFNN